MTNELNRNNIKSTVEELLVGPMIPFSDLISPMVGDCNYYRFKPGSDKGNLSVEGVYAIWWTGSKDAFQKKSTSTLMVQTGNSKTPEGRTNIEIHLNKEWINSYNDRVALYVGKATNIKKRLGQHLRLNTSKCKNQSSKSSTFRKRLEQLFPEVENYPKLINEELALTYTPVGNPVDRFYAEDRAIGEYFPILNFDVER